MWLLSFAVCLLLYALAWMIIAIAGIYAGRLIGFNSSHWGNFCLILGLFATLFPVGPWASHHVFEFCNQYLPPNRQLDLQRRPIPLEYQILKDGEVRDIRWEKGWRPLLLSVIFIAVVLYLILFTES
jgi:hypothetical protein